MATFKDIHGYQWKTDLTLADAMNVERSDYSLLTNHEYKLSLLNMDEKSVARLMSNLGLIFAVIWTIVRDEAYVVLKLPPETPEETAQQEWMKRFDGDALMRGRAAFWEGLRDFFPSMRTLLSNLEQSQIRLENRVAEKIESTNPQINAALDAALDARFDEILTDLKTNLLTVGEKSTT